MDITLINENDQKYAQEKLNHYYKDGMIPAEKKAYLTELSNNAGPFMGIETADSKTHFLLDAASQIATLGLGFSPSVFMGTCHFLSSWNNDPKDPTFLKLKSSFHSFLLRETGWRQLNMTIANSGAESNEIALGYAYARRKNKKAKKVLAFEGSFHGRMLVALYSTWNKTKREPFTWKGFETMFTEFPELPGSEIHQDFPKNWRKVWDNAPHVNFGTPNEWSEDAVLDLEVKSLKSVRDKIHTGDYFAIVVEPMQCEGGDRYGSDRFFTALLIMAKAYGVEVIFDEVQTGFHLGRSFFWHRQFCLRDENNHQLNPDYLVCAKKAQVGLVLSPHNLDENRIKAREQYQVPSVVRGYIHAISLQQSKSKIQRLEKIISEKLKVYASKNEQFISRPRSIGMTFAFDLKDESNIAPFIEKRFNHGLLYYPAGKKSLRFRLNTSYSNQDIDFLFERLQAISDEIFHQGPHDFDGKTKTKDRNSELPLDWHKLILQARFDQMRGKVSSDADYTNDINLLFKKHYSDQEDIKLIFITSQNFNNFKEDIESLQIEVYEPTRRTSIERFEKCAHSPYGVCLGVTKKDKLIGMAFSSSLSEHPLERGLRQDQDFNDPKSLYVIDTTVSKELQGAGLGKFLKYAQMLISVSKGYHFIKGRNRDQLAAGMLNINNSLGAFEQFYLREDYPDFEEFRDVIYYQLPLQWQEKINLSNRLNSGITASEIDFDFIRDQVPYLTNKVCLSNFVSERFLEHVKAIIELAPKDLQHSYTASGQSECVDKAFKSLIYHNKDLFNEKTKLLTFKGHFFGMGSFLSRSLSSPSNDSFFPTEVLDHPDDDNYEVIFNKIKKLIKEKRVNSVWIEPVRQEDYEKVPHAFLKKLSKLCHKKDIPLVFNDTGAQQFNYDDDNYFSFNHSELNPSCAFAFLGGQAGIIFCNEKYFVSKPLMMISTWDGDEHAFASYHKAFNKILSNRNDYFETRKTFHNKVCEILKDYPNTKHNLRNGLGVITGSLPNSFKDYFEERQNGLYCSPSYQSMKNFLNND